MAVHQVKISGGLGFGVASEDKRLVDRIDKWSRAVSDLRSFWIEKFAPKFLGDIQTNWDQEGRMVGGWAPNAPGYAMWKRRRYGAHLGVLELTLRLRGSLQWLGRDIGPEGIFRPMMRSLEIGTRVKHAAKHQYGLDGMKQRRFFFIAQGKEYDALWREWITERAQESGIDVE